MPRPLLTVRRMMVAVAFVALIAAFFVQRRDADTRLVQARKERDDLALHLPEGNTLALYSRTEAKLEAAGDRVLIAASVSLMNRKPNPAYVWEVRIADPASKEVVFRKRYDKRVFHPGRGQDSHPTLVDILHPSLPGGDYLVKLTLLEVPPGGLVELDEEKIRDHFAITGASGLVTLTPEE